MGLDARAYAEPAVLRDGGSLLIRALRPDDKPGLLDLFRRLSPESIRHRAFTMKTRLTPQELGYLTEIDFVRHVALAAILDEKIVGVGRYCTTTDNRRAELAFVVADEHQRRGIGTLLLEHLARLARAAGIEELEADVMADNAMMMTVFAESGFVVEKSLTSGIYHVRFPSSETDAFVRASITRERRSAAESVRVFFEPKSVALIGASRREGSIGHAILSNLRRCGFQGPIYPINPHASELLGLPAFPSVGATPGKVDLAIIAVPSREVEDVVAECARAHVRGVVVISSGFAETGADGRAAQQRLRSLVRGSGMRMVGPNCLGVLNATPSIALNATFAPTWPPAGNVSMSTQSGALGIAMLDHAARLNIGLSGFVSVGNKADVSGNDLLSYWANDPSTQVIALYLESFGNPRKFARIAPEVARKKPIVAVKSGRSISGTRAATSHSAALASADVSVDALFAQAGVIRTSTLEELFDVVALLSTQPLPEGRRIGIVTNAGGPGILLADACEAHGLEVPVLTDETLASLRGFLPKTAGLANPIRGIVGELVARHETAFWVDPPDVTRILELAGIPLVPTKLVPPKAEDAVSAARALGYPVVAKAVAKGLVHKTEAGGVILGLYSDNDVRAATHTLLERLGPRLEGILLQCQVDGLVEAIAGVTVDASFGPLIVTGLGGVQVELLRDVAVRLTPVSDLDAEEMLDGLRAAKLLDGYEERRRSIEPRWRR